MTTPLENKTRLEVRNLFKPLGIDRLVPDVWAIAYQNAAPGSPLLCELPQRVAWWYLMELKSRLQ